MSFFPNQAISIVGSPFPVVAEQIAGNDGTNLRVLLTSATGQLHTLVDNFPATQPVSGTISVTNAGTFAVQDSVAEGFLATLAGSVSGGFVNTNLAEVGGAAFSLGQQLAAASLPVVLTAAQLSTLTPLSTVAVTQSTSPWVVSLASTTITGTVAVTGTFFQATQPVSIASTVIVAGNLTTNNAAPIGDNIGVLPAVANAVSPTYTEGNQVLLSTDLSGALRVNVGTVTASNDITEWAGVVLGSPSNYGTAPGAVEVIGVNAFVTNTVDVTGTVAVSGTVAVTQSGTWTVGLSAGSNVIGHVITDSGSTTVVTGTVAVTGTFFQAIQPVSGTVTANQGTSPWVVSLASTTITGTVAVTQSTSPWVISGTVTTTPSGLQNVNVTQWDTIALGAPSAYGTSPGAVNVIGVNAFVTNTVATTLASTTITGTVAVTQSTSPWVVSLASTTITGTVAENLTQVAGVTLGATAVTAYGTAPAAANVPGVNAFVTNTVATTLASTTITGTVAVTQSTSPWVVSLASTTITGTVAVTGTFFQATQPVSGTVTANQGTSPWTVAGGLTNNNAAPAANNVGVLSAVASVAAPTYTAGDQVLLSTDLAGNLRVAITGSVIANNNITEWNSVALGSPSAYGTGPGAVNVIGVNAFVTNTVATTLASTTITGTVAVTQSTSPWVVSLTSTTITGTVSVTQGTSPWVITGTDADNATNSTSKLPVLAARVNAFAPSWTEGHEVPLSTDLSGNLRVTGSFTTVGALTNNNAAPAATNLGVLSAIAETAYGTVTYTTGNQVLPVTDLHGALNQDLQAIGGAAVVSSAAGVQEVGIVGNAGATLDATVAAGTAPTNALGSLVQYKATIPALTTNQTINQQSDTTGSTYVNTEGRKPTYSTSATFTAAAGVIAVMPGSASKTIRILRVEVSLSTSGTAAIETISLIATSAAPSGGTSASMTVVPHDSGFAGASAAPLSYTVAPTAGTPVGTIRSVQFADSSAAALPGANTWLWDWGMRPGSAVVLRGVAQTLEVNLGGAVATQTATVSYEWTEE